MADDRVTRVTKDFTIRYTLGDGPETIKHYIESCRDKLAASEPLEPFLRNWLTNVLTKIVDGEDPKKAFGLTYKENHRPPGRETVNRAKASFLLEDLYGLKAKDAEDYVATQWGLSDTRSIRNDKKYNRAHRSNWLEFHQRIKDKNISKYNRILDQLRIYPDDLKQFEKKSGT